MGKDWAKGLMATTDTRVARSAAAHRGIRYRPRQADRRALIPLAWSPHMAYVVGLMATDGCLVGDRRHLALTSADVDLLDYFFDCARGLLDGDGSISNFVHAPTRRLYPEYQYERLMLKFHSASRSHIDWLRTAVLRLAQQRGHVSANLPKGRSNPVYVLTYGKHASIALLTQMYRAADAPRLVRKHEIWRAYCDRQLGAGRDSSGQATPRTISWTPT